MTMARDERDTTARGIPTDTFGRRLMLARDYAGNLSIREAADLCGIGRGAWTNWERGARPVDMLEVVEIVSEKLKVDRDWLLFGGALTKPESSLRSRMATRLRRDTEEYGGRPVRASRRGPRTPLSALVGGHRHQTGERGSAARPMADMAAHSVDPLSGPVGVGVCTTPTLARPAVLPRRTTV